MTMRISVSGDEMSARAFSMLHTSMLHESVCKRLCDLTLLGMETGTPRSVRTVVLSRLMASTTPDTIASPLAVSSTTRSPLLNVLLKNCHRGLRVMSHQSIGTGSFPRRLIRCNLQQCPV